MGGWIGKFESASEREDLSAYIASLPFKDTIKFAGELSCLLKRESPWLQGVSLPCKKFMPIISPNPLHARFKVETVMIGDDCTSGVHLIVREAYTRLKEAVLKRDDRKGIYLHGAVGIGKSSLLYTLVTYLRIEQSSGVESRIRVTYVNDCAAWANSPYDYLLNELVATFANDSLRIEKLAENVLIESQQYARETKLRRIINIVFAYVRTKNIKWFVIIDQLNALFKTSNPLYGVFPFSLIELLATSKLANILVSASANNAAFPAEFQNWEKHDLDVLPVKYDEKEFELWSERIVPPPSEDETRQIKYWTGAIPLELDIAH